MKTPGRDDETVRHRFPDVFDTLGLPESLFDLLPTAIYICDVDGMIVRYNRRVVELLGRVPRLGEPAARFCSSYRLYRLDGGLLPLTVSPVTEVLRTGVAVRDLEVVIERPDRPPAAALVSVEAIRNDAGRVVGAVTCLHDITERQQAEALPQRNALLAGQVRILEMVATAAPLAKILNELTHFIAAQAEGLHCRILPAAGGVPEPRPGDAIDFADTFPAGGAVPNGVPTTPVLGSDGRLLASLALYFDPPRALPPIDPQWTEIATRLTRLAFERQQRVVEDRRRDLEDFFENGAVALHLVGRDGTILRANQAELDLLGYTREEYIGRNIADFHDEATIKDILDRLFSGKGLNKYPARMRAKDGSFRHVQITSNALIENGQFVNTRCFTVDVTAQVQAEELLRHRERRVRDLLGALPVAVYTTDAEGRITFYNHAAAQLWGRRPVLGEDKWCGSLRLYWPDGRPMRHDECSMAETLQQGRAIRGAETKAERPDGTRVAFLAFPTPLRDSSGVLTGALNTLVDITERNHAWDVDQRLTAIVDSCDEAIISTDLNGVIATWNRGAERLYGYRAEEAVGKPVTLLAPADHSDEEPAILARIRRGDPIDHSEVTRRRRDGSLVEVSLSLSPVRDAQGRITGAAKIARDISDRKRAEEQQMLLLREMNHRIKNLFAVANSVVTLSARSANTPAEMVTVIQGRLGALARAYRLVRPDLLRPGETVDRDTTLGEMIHTILLPYIGAEGFDFHTRVTVDGPEVSLGGSAVTSMALVLHELATNAAKYGALSVPDGTVAIDWSVQAENLSLHWVERNGPPLEGPPPSEGFGSQLARASIGSQLGGRLAHKWRPDGLTIEVVIPTDHLTR